MNRSTPTAQPLTCKLIRIGKSAAIVIPKAIAEMNGWEPRTVLKVSLGNEELMRELKAFYSGGSTGILIPKAVMDSNGWTIGDTIAVAFHEWTSPAPKY